MTLTSRTTTMLRCWSARFATAAVAVLAVVALAALLLSFSLVANIVHLAGELAVASAAGTRPPPILGGRWEWPLPGVPTVLRRFDPPSSPWLSGHRGVDLRGDLDTAVFSAGQGVIRYAGNLAGRGVVSVEHPNGLRTTYEPLNPVVQVGQHVRLGDLLGTLAAAHEPCRGACLHWGLRSAKEYFDPLGLFGRHRVRLLPLAGG